MRGACGAVLPLLAVVWPCRLPNELLAVLCALFGLYAACLAWLARGAAEGAVEGGAAKGAVAVVGGG